MRLDQRLYMTVGPVQWAGRAVTRTVGVPFVLVVTLMPRRICVYRVCS